MWCLTVWRWSRKREPDVSYFETWEALLEEMEALRQDHDVRQFAVEKPVPP